MIRALMAKELRQLIPLVLALLALEAVGIGQLVLRQPMDELTWRQMSVLLDPQQAPGVAGLMLMLSVIAAYMLYPREYDQGSIGFLYSLPVHPGTVFTAKVATASLVLLGVNALDYVLILAIQKQNTSSISGTQFTLFLWSLEWLMVSAFLLIGLGYGMLISFFRRFGILVAAAMVGLFALLAELDPAFRHLQLGSLLTLEFDGTRPIVASRAWLAHGIASAGCLLLARSLWLNKAEAFTMLNARIGQRAVYRVAISALVATVLTGTAVLLLMRKEYVSSDAAFVENPTQDILTEHYHFRYLAPERSGALALSASADAGHSALRRLLGASPSPPIIADLTDRSSEHLGIAGWQKVRIERGILDDPLLRHHVLMHETTHVMAAAESVRRLGEHHEDGQFFIEGLAEWAAHQVHDYPDSRMALLDHAAAAWQRFGLRFDDLLSRSALVAEHDEWLTYALGFAWQEALVATCTVSAPGDALRAMGRGDMPRDLGGRRFWQQVLQVIGCDLSAVNARLARMLSEHAVDPRRIPRVRGSVFETSDELLVFEVSVEPADPDRTYEVAVRVRDGAHMGRSATVQRGASIEFARPALVYVPNQGLGGQRFEFQVGVEFATGQPMFFERWRSAVLP